MLTFYSDYGYNYVTKVECANHAVKCYGNWGCVTASSFGEVSKQRTEYATLVRLLHSKSHTTNP